ncbi:MAG: hypothetical protein Q7T93_13300 [Methylobacterium sp.]|uniref:hypothetical protein n=1 Tax=Methylobacterium sp. TaxID=409 RepID=UPI002715ADAB|nr:hypothetical protein [Methylobacterium sp.]MDO9427793.1 hypothetical protein [Methylobacterium sp.]
MALPLFSTWTRLEVVSALRDLEGGLATGAAEIQYPNGGGTKLVSRMEALQTIRGLYARLDVLDNGTDPNKPSTAGVRFIRGIPRRGV